MNLRILLFVFALWLGIGAATQLAPASLLADDAGIEVTKVSAESQFPDGIRFHIEARSNDEIDEIRVFFLLLGGSLGSAYRAVDFSPGTSISGESILLSGTGGKYIPPGTILRYSFEVRDKGGGLYRTDDQEMIYTDGRFDWETASSGLITVFYYDGDAEKAKGVLDAASEAMERMAPVLGLESSDPMRILTYNDYSDMLLAIPFRSQATREQLITEGLAFADQRVLLVFNPGDSAKGTVAHEFTHLLVAQAVGRGHRQIPAWLNEGLAEYGNIDPSFSYEGALRRAIETDRLNPLWYQRVAGSAGPGTFGSCGGGDTCAAYQPAHTISGTTNQRAHGYAAPAHSGHANGDTNSSHGSAGRGPGTVTAGRKPIAGMRSKSQSRRGLRFGPDRPIGRPTCRVVGPRFV